MVLTLIDIVGDGFIGADVPVDVGANEPKIVYNTGQKN